MSARRSSTLFVLVIAALGLLVAAGCGVSRTPASSPSPSSSAAASPSALPASPAASPSASPSTAGTIVVSVYFLRGDFIGVAHRSIPATGEPAKAAMNELLLGPNAVELAAGLHTQVPAGTRLLGLSIQDGLAIVDLSGQFAAGVDPTEDRARLGQIVYTLTQFPTVDGVRFRLDGKPLVFRAPEGKVITRPQTRRSFEDVTPPIFVERPAVGDVVASPLVVSGTANTFEAQLMLRVVDGSGAVLLDQSVLATSGTGTRGTFDASLTFAAVAPRITLVAYESSAASGLPVHVVRIPLKVSGESGPSPSP